MASVDRDAPHAVQTAAAPTLTRGFLFSDLRGYAAFVVARGTVMTA